MKSVMKSLLMALIAFFGITLMTSSFAFATIDKAECKRWINQKWTGTDEGVGHDPSVGETIRVEHLSSGGRCVSEQSFPGIWFKFKFWVNAKSSLKKECCHFTEEETDGDIE